MSMVNQQILTSIISASAIILGSLLGALFTWIITNKATCKNIQEQHKILDDQRKYEELNKYKELCKHSNIIRLDIYNAIYQSIRGIKYYNKGNFTIYPIARNNDYVKTIAAISGQFSLKELSYIYQFYGVIDRLNNEIMKNKFGEDMKDEELLKGYLEVLKKVYGENYEKIINLNVENVGYIDLVENNEIKSGYKNILIKLNNLC